MQRDGTLKSIDVFLAKTVHRQKNLQQNDAKIVYEDNFSFEIVLLLPVRLGAKVQASFLKTN